MGIYDSREKMRKKERERMNVHKRNDYRDFLIKLIQDLRLLARGEPFYFLPRMARVRKSSANKYREPGQLTDVDGTVPPLKIEDSSALFDYRV